MHTHDSLLKELKSLTCASYLQLSVAFCFFLSEKALLLQAKINAINTLKVTITLTRPVRELNYYTYASRELFPIPGRVYIIHATTEHSPRGVACETNALHEYHVNSQEYHAGTRVQKVVRELKWSRSSPSVIVLESLKRKWNPRDTASEKSNAKEKEFDRLRKKRCIQGESTEDR